jgi:flagellar hook-length control protein FliK
VTSIPVNNSVKGIVPGAQTQKKSNTQDAAGSFSDIFKNQKNDNGTDDGKIVSAAQNRTENRNTGISARQRKVQDAVNKAGDAAEKNAGKKVDEAADKMLSDTAEELSVTEEELLSVLQSLSLTPADLLTKEGLQQVVLAVSGETDFANFLTDETMFTTLQNLCGELQTTLSDLADELGISQDEVQDFLTALADKAGDASTLQAEALSAEEFSTEEFSTEETEDAVTDVEKGSDTENITGDKTASEVNVPGKETGKQTEKETSGEEKSFTGDKAFDNFAQSFKTGQTQNTQAAAEVTPHFDVETENIIRQITDYMRGNVTDGVSEMDMQLHPASLGSVHIHLEAKEGVLTAQFTAQNESVKAALESQMIQLKDSFEEQGLTVESIEVMVSSQKFDQSYEEAESHANDTGSRSGRQRTRRAGLHVSMEDEELSDEEILAKEVLKGQGSTVEFTA